MISGSDSEAASGSCSFSDDSDEITLPPELLERERQLIERNRQLEARVQDLLRSSSLEEEATPVTVTLDTEVTTVKQRAKVKALPMTDGLPAARSSPTKRGIIEVDIPVDVEPIREVHVDPLPELREIYRKIAREIRAVNDQIASSEEGKTKAELAVTKLQTDMRRAQIDNKRAQQMYLELTKQIETANETIATLRNDVEAERLSRIERVQQESEAASRQSQLETKVRRQRAIADKLQSELNVMQSVDARASRANSEKLKLKHIVEEQKKAIRGLKVLLSEVQRSTAHEERVFEHIQRGRDLTLTSATVERAITELL